MPPTYYCRKTMPFDIDGNLAKPEWSRAEPARLLDAATGDLPANETTVRLLWDERNLYAAFHSVGSWIHATYTERDDPLYEQDAVEIFLDVGSTGWAYYEFEVSPRNVQMDLFIVNGGRSEKKPFHGFKQWDCAGWRSAVRVDGEVNSLDGTDRSWDSEWAIPFEALVGAPNTPPLPGDEWRFNIYRLEQTPGRPVSASALSPTGRPDFHVPDRFATLRFEE